MTTWTLIVVFALPQFEWAEKEYPTWGACLADLRHLERDIDFAFRRIHPYRRMRLADLATYGCFPNYRLADGEKF